MRIAVIGCGGIGGVVAGILSSQMSDVVCIDIDEETVRRINDSGITLKGKKGNVTTRVRAVRRLDEAEGKFDIIVITVKCMYLRDVFKQAKDFLSADGSILALQNGVETLEIGNDFPAIKTIAGAVGYNSQKDENGEYIVTTQGGITIGNLTTGSEQDLFKLKKIFDPGIKMEISRNIKGVLWSKLLIVCGVTGLGGCAGLLLGELLRLKEARQLFYRVVTEGVSVSKKLNIQLEKFGGAINPEKFGDHKEGYPIFARYLLLKLIGITHRNIKSNIHQSLERGEKTEVDFINGAVEKAGRALGIDTPVNREIVRVVKEIEQGTRRMTIENLRGIAAL